MRGGRTTEILDLYSLAEHDGIDVYWFDLETAESLSVMAADGSCAIAMNPWRMSTQADEKVKLAHELGHCETGSFYSRFAALDVRKKHENRADKWAIEQLVPKEKLLEATLRGYKEVWELADYFGVTEEFIRKSICWHRHGNLAIDLYI